MTRRALTIAPWLVACSAAAWLTGTKLRVENPGGFWDPREPAPAARFWAFARSQFGEREVVLIGVHLPAAALDLRSFRPFEEWLSHQPEVATVFGPAAVQRLERGLGTRFALGDQLGDLRAAVFRRNDRFGLVYVTLNPPPVPGSLELKIAFLGRLESEGSLRLPRGSRLYTAGKPSLDVALNAMLAHDMRFAPVPLVAMALLLLAAYGRRATGPLIGVSAAALLLLGGLALVGLPISTATVLTLPITIVVGSAYGIHVAGAIARTGDVLRGRRLVLRPLTWCFLTTAFALVMFGLAPIPALRAYGYAATLGVGLAFSAALTLVPALSSSRAGTPGHRRRWAALAVRCTVVSARHPMTTAVIWLLLVAAAVAGLYQLRVEPNNYLQLFPSGHPVLVAHHVIDSVLGGSLPLEVLAEADSGSAWRRDDVRERVRSFLREASAAERLGPGFAPFFVGGDPVLGQWFEGRDPRFTRAVVNVPIVPTVVARGLLARLDTMAARHSGDGVTLTVTGNLPANLPLLRTLVVIQLQSLGLMLAAVALGLMVAARSVRRGALFLIPNLLPALVVGGAMGALGIALDFTTVVVLSLLTGVAVDDTFQIALAPRTQGNGGLRPYAGAAAVRTVGKEVTLTSVCAIAGFLALLGSPFPPTARLGGLMALGLFTAWLADVTITPRLVRLDQRASGAKA